MAMIHLEEMLSAAFRGGERRRRELRLSEEEARYLRARYARICLTPLPTDGSGKTWFEVSFA